MIIIYVCMFIAWLCLTLCNPMDCPCLSMEFSRQEYWSGLPFPSPGDLPDPGIKPESPAFQADSLLSEPPGKPIIIYGRCIFDFIRYCQCFIKLMILFYMFTRNMCEFYFFHLSNIWSGLSF